MRNHDTKIFKKLASIALSACILASASLAYAADDSTSSLSAPGIRTPNVPKNRNKTPEAPTTATPVTTPAVSTPAVNATVNTGNKSINIEEKAAEFMSLLKAGKSAEALATYREIIGAAETPDNLTGDSVLSSKIAKKLASASKKIQKAKSATIKSNLYILEGNAQYEAGDYFYFRGYPGVAIYRYLLAIEAYDNSISSSDSAAAHRQKSVAMLDIGLPASQSVIELEKALALDPNDELSYYKLGNIYFMQIEDLDKALWYYLKAKKLNPKHELLLNNLALVYDKMGNTPMVDSTYNEFFKICTEYCHMGKLNASSGKPLNVKLTMLNEAIEFAKTKGVTYRNAYAEKGRVLFQMKKYAEALESYKMAIDDPSELQRNNNTKNKSGNPAWLFVDLAETEIELKDMESAKSYLEIAKARNEEEKDEKVAARIAEVEARLK